MAEARFNPVGAERMLMTLQRLDKNPAGGLDRYFMSHPDPAKRVNDVRRKIQEMAAAAPASYQAPNREAFVRRLDGIITGNSTENIVVRDGTIYDRSHGLIIRTPSGWEAGSEPGTLFAMSPLNTRSQLSLIAQEVPANQLQGANVQDAVRRRLQQMGLQFAGTRETRTRTGERFPIDAWVGQTQSGQVGVETTQFMHGDHVAVFMFLAPSLSRTQSPLGQVLEDASIDPSRARAVEPPRMKIGTVRRGESWADIARRATGNPNDAEAVANINGFDLRDAPQAGLVVKLPSDVVRT
jgi:predicted Zn-dependent protease